MSLDAFHPATRAWFEQHLGSPTAAQSEAWPAIQQGKNTLIAAPTGSGKTLAAFYVAIDQLVQLGLRGPLDDSTRILYVSPLKALGNDIQRNLEQPLDGIAEQLHLHGCPPVNIRVGVRTGDTSAYERQRMLKKPPHILVTTPESLYLLLTSRGGRQVLSSVTTLIVDEIHALLGDKRGSHLSLSIERLQHLTAGRLQRIGLSATQKPIALVARFLVGNHQPDDKGRMDCAIIDGGHRKHLDLSLEVPQSPLSALMSNEVWEELYARLVALINTHRTTLIFVNTRRLAERLALSLGAHIGEEFISSHHGSMSKDHRHQAEQKLKSGELRVLVATASMELGIDIGSVNLVLQISSPHSIAAFLQRVGRSGHQVGGLPKGILFPLTRDDLVECAALLDSVRRGELDAVVMPEKPLDVLAQQLVAELGSLEDGEEGMALDELFTLVRRSWVYRDLDRDEFMQVIAMLARGYTSRRGRSGAWLHLDQVNDRVRPRKGARLTALTNGGAIPDMFDYQVVLDPEETVVGSLNEDFALEALPGDIFTLGNHSWRLLRIDGLKVRVADAQGLPPSIPFWFGEGPGRTRELSEAVSRLRVELRELLDHSLEKARDFLLTQIGLQSAAAEQLLSYLKAGSDALEVMPSRECLVMERFFDEVGDMHLVIHSPFGSRLNRAWGLALRKRFCRSFNFELQAAASEDSIVISLGSVHSFPLAEVFNYLHSSSVRELLVQALLDAPMFEVRWRWNATRALAIQRNRSGKRVPPQFQRMQAEDLVAQVFPDQIACFENLQGPRRIPDHPLVSQTIHDCLTEAMDIDGLEALLKKIENNQLQLLAKDLREPSPFAQEIINARPYAFLDDAPFEERRTNAIRHRSWLDPAETTAFSTLDRKAIERVRGEAWPWIRSAEELHDALLLLGFLSAEEISANPDHDAAIYLEPLLKAGRITQLSGVGGGVWLAAERLPQFMALGMDWHCQPSLVLPAAIASEQWSRQEALREIIRGRLEALGPVTVQVLGQPLALPDADVEGALLALETEGFVFQGCYTPDTRTQEWCERRLLQRIHRYTLESHRESIRPVSLQTYMRFLFDWQGLQSHEGLPGTPSAGPQALLQVLQGLDGYTAPAAAWESDILPGRLPDYDPAWLDVLCISGKISWGRTRLGKGGSRMDALQAAPLSRKAGPIKTTPLNILQRENLDIWQALAREQGAAERQQLGSVALSIVAALEKFGASFFDDLVKNTGCLKTQVEAGLAELVNLGFVSSDSFTGLRALLTPSSHKTRRRGGSRRALFGIEEAGRWSLLSGNTAALVEPALSDAQLERLIHVYLMRWGVLSRKVLERESQPPPWRILLLKLRRMELRGELRGGRFIAGIGGEQFALPETVNVLRRQHQAGLRGEGSDPALQQPQRHVLSAADPLNLLGIILPGSKVAASGSNRILFEDGLPLAILEKDEVRFLRDIGPEQQWTLQQHIQRRCFPPRLRAYLGRP
ncbi:MAG: DEAD/DEAH box helicase [Pseudomonadales bacterium]|nr:DEAD/DEAH box helicase [Pseudomonadales bacterium]